MGVGCGNQNKGIRWLAWDKMMCAKREGDLGFRDFKVFTRAMLVKQGYHIIQTRSLLWLESLKPCISTRSSFF